MKTTKKLNEGIRVAKEGIEECWDDMGGQGMTQGNGEQMSVTISMPGKNISVTTDSAEEIGSILRLAGINVGDGGVPGDVDGDGDHDVADHAAELAGSDEQVMYVGAGNPEESNGDSAADIDDSDMDNADPTDDIVTDREDEKEEETKEAVGDTTTTHKGGTVTQTATGQVHKAGPGNYGGSDDDEEKEQGSMYKKSSIPDEEVEESAEIARIRHLAGLGEGKKPDFLDVDKDGNKDEPMKDALDDKEKIDENDKAKQLKRATKMLIQKCFNDHCYPSELGNHRINGIIDATGLNREEITGLADRITAKWREEEIRSEAEKSSMSEASRIVALAGLEEARLMNAPDGTSMPEPQEYTLINKLGKGAGHRDYGQNRANNQGENPMGMHTADIDSVEEAFQAAMGEYRKFVAENISRKK